MHKIQPVILSGGSGTRLWPLSRFSYPKQFIRFFGPHNPSLLEATLRRLTPEDGFEAPMVLCNEEHRFLVRDEAARANIAPKAIILEPVARNTAPAIAVAALAASRDDDSAIIAVMPSDHVVENVKAFVAGVRTAAAAAMAGRLVLFGVKATSPHTGYGYIRRGASLEDVAPGVFAVASFLEKPTVETAAQYVAEDGYYWNSGVFLFHARTFLEELATLNPRILEASQDALAGATEDLGFLRLKEAPFAESPNISVDYAVMEKSAIAAVLPIDVGWSDVGSWSSLWDIAPCDAQGNYVHGEAVMEDAAGCYVHSDKSLVAALGVKDLVVVNTADALLVADKSRAQDVSGIVSRLKSSGRKEHQQHVRNQRPWGYFETLSLGSRFHVKILHVKPGGALSMQRHYHRSEHWVVVHGTATVVVGENETLVRENESVYIVATQWHRLRNDGKVPLEIIEVQIGTYLGEDDIERSIDDYNRPSKQEA